MQGIRTSRMIYVQCSLYTANNGMLMIMQTFYSIADPEVVPGLASDKTLSH